MTTSATPPDDTRGITWRTQLSRSSVDYVRRLAGETDAYRLLSTLAFERRMSSRAVGIRHAMEHYALFLKLTAKYPPGDQDALLAIARDVFAVRLRVLRSDLRRAQAEAAQAKTTT